MDKDTIFICALICVVVILAAIAHLLDDNKEKESSELNRLSDRPQRASFPFLMGLYPSLIDCVANRLVSEKNPISYFSFRYNARAITKRLASPPSLREAQRISDFIDKNRLGFEDRLRNKQLLDDRGQLLTDNVDMIANELYLFYKERRRNNQPGPEVGRQVTDSSRTILSDGISPTEFFNLRKNLQGDVVGVYILLNINKCKHYVGQAKRVYFRVNQHFTGKGNQEVYADYMFGNTFRIKIIRLNDSGYYDLDKLEKDMIAKYDAFNSGYNKTIGNGV